ncbi:MAG TPA: hypothetical protein VFW77_01125 [Candidatus Saccharimonadales bacterium]|nr:hypothetical protein [Candidatus Saccharimonadales bacterium]
MPSPVVLQETDLLTRAELIKQLLALDITDGLDLEVIDEEGESHRGLVGYSSDLAAFAIMTYGPYGEGGEEGITSWYPLPTRSVGRFPGEAIEYTKHKEQNGNPDTGVRYRIVG